uniref:Uncharacterized protein n=1 Tax=Oryza glumipatula TaxID=40148 RepID=A0A0D9Y980_9ORYZ
MTSGHDGFDVAGYGGRLQGKVPSTAMVTSDVALSGWDNFGCVAMLIRILLRGNVDGIGVPSDVSTQLAIIVAAMLLYSLGENLVLDVQNSDGFIMSQLLEDIVLEVL